MGYLNNVDLRSERFENLVMALRCIQFFAEHNASRYEIKKLKDRIPTLLEAIESSEFLNNINLGELMEISTIFINHLKIPDFLFSNLVKKLETSDLEKVKRKILKNFIESLMDRHQEFYVYNQFNIDEFDYNNKWTKDTLEVLRILLSKLSKSRFSSNILLALRIASHPEILHDITPKEATRKQLVEHLIISMNTIISRISGSFRLEYTKESLKVLALFPGEHGVSEAVIPFLERIGFAVRVYIQQAPESAEVLEYLYYLLKAIDKVNSEDKLSLQALRSQLQTLFRDTILPKVISKCQNLVHEIMFDNEVKQHFNPNIYLSDYAQVELLPSIISLLNTKLEPRVTSNLISLFERTSKRWAGEILFTNLLFLQKHKVLIQLPRWTQRPST